MDIKNLNEEMLKTCKNSWSNPNPISPSDINLLITMGYHKTAATLLQNKLINKKALAIKDPRISKLLAFWRIVFDNAGAKISYIFAIRNPLSVAHSLKKRNNFNLHKSYLLWASYNLEILRNIEDVSFLIIEYERFLEYPLEEIQRIKEYTCLGLDGDKMDAFIKDYLDRSMQHTQFNLSTILENQQIFTLVKDLYEYTIDLDPFCLTRNNALDVVAMANWSATLNDLILALNFHEEDKEELEIEKSDRWN